MRGYQIVDIGLAGSAIWRDYDAQVRCLSYLIGRIEEVAVIPPGVLFEVIPVQHLGGTYPVIGLYTDTFVDTDENLCRLSFKIEEGLETLVKQIGLDNLVALSLGEKTIGTFFLPASARCQNDRSVVFGHRLTPGQAPNSPTAKPTKNDCTQLYTPGRNGLYC